MSSISLLLMETIYSVGPYLSKWFFSNGHNLFWVFECGRCGCLSSEHPPRQNRASLWRKWKEVYLLTPPNLIGDLEYMNKPPPNLLGDLAGGLFHYYTQ